MFKLKPSKKIEETATVMVDTKHQEFMDQFKEDDEVIIPKLQEEIEQYKQLDKMDKVKILEQKINSIRQKQIQYYLTNNHHIFAYFEEKKNISDCKVEKKIILNQFFNLDKSSNKVQKMNTHAMQYLTNIQENFINTDQYIYNTSVCQKCKRGELIQVDFEGYLVCNNDSCACQYQYLIDNEKPSYKEPPKEVCFYAYKRINHFREILAQFQAKESTQIPNDILENIQAQIKKERLTIHSITNKKTKEILKKFGYNKYYEHIPFIKDKLGIRPPVMTPELEDKLCNLFMEIQRPYSKYCPEDRVNFLNYYYTIYKLCELLGENEFLPFFPMLKDREKKIQQDEIWEKICEDLNWEFVPTV
jgi:hypothetical protein